MRKHWTLRLLAVLFSFALLASACGDDSSDDGADGDGTGDGSGDGDTVDLVQDGSVLQKVLDADVLECGGNSGLAGFGVIDAESGDFSGFDIDFCRVVAAAVLGDASKINVTPLEAAQRFPTLQSGEIDVLIRNTTWTAGRDGGEQGNFLHTTFYDGQGFMVRADSSIQSLEDMADASVCVQTGTTTLSNLNAVFADRGIPFTAAEYESNDELQPAFLAEACEVWTSDASQLTAFAAGMEIETRILPDIISKEPLGPVVADGDTQWAQIVDWATMATIAAWELGIDSTNVDSFADTDNTSIRELLGLPVVDDDGNEAVKDVGLGLSPDFAMNIISQVGNYQEIFESNLAPIGLTLEGSPNDLWSNGGLQYVPPFR